MRDRLLRDGYLILAAVFVGLRLFAVPPWSESVDAYAYWTTRYGIDYAAAETGTIGAYLYSPAFAQVLTPFVALPWPVFAAAWTALLLGVHWWLAGRWALPLLLFVPISFEIVSGNVHLLFAAAIVLGFRYPAAWAIVLLTKVTPGIGLIWFAVRREWRALAWALGATAAIVAVSYLLDADAWAAWFAFLRSSATVPIETVGWYLPVPLLPRLALAVAIIAWGAWSDRRWTLPIGVTLALPVVWLNGLAILDALVAIAAVQGARAWLGRPPAVAVLPGAPPAVVAR